MQVLPNVYQVYPATLTTLNMRNGGNSYLQVGVKAVGVPIGAGIPDKKALTPSYPRQQRKIIHLQRPDMPVSLFPETPNRLVAILVLAHDLRDGELKVLLLHI